jgi:hypothetical protein
MPQLIKLESMHNQLFTKMNDLLQKYLESILDLNLKNSVLTPLSGNYKDLLKEYGEMNIRSQNLEKLFCLMENLLKAMVLRSGKKKAGWTVFEKILDSLEGVELNELDSELV